jgi:streptomycin 6-kinase
LAPGRFARQVAVVADAAALDPRRLVEWTLAFAGLSAAWHIADSESADLDLAVARLATATL